MMRTGLRLPRGRARIALLVAVALGATWWLAAGGENAVDADWVEVRTDDLVLGLEVTGTLRAVDSSQLGPPQIADHWEYKISSLAEEGKEVRRGEPVLGFDATTLERKLEEKLAEGAAAQKKIEQKEIDAALLRHKDELELAEADAKARKARLIVDRPGDLAAAKELEKARLDLEEAEKGITFIRARMGSSRRADEVSLQNLRSQRDAAERRVREIRTAIDEMTVKAPRDGTVVLVDNWRDEKKKVGDSVWRGEKIIEIPDLRKITAKGEVDEADVGRVTTGLVVTLRLDAHPDVEYKGKVSSVWGTVTQRSWRDPLKVVRIDIDLDTTDAIRMRPGMRFRGSIETERIRSAVVVPVEAVFPTREGPIAFRKTVMGYEVVALELGRRSDKLVEVIEGVREGDRLARRNLGAVEKRGA
jgi:HlyD family secretion protein